MLPDIKTLDNISRCYQELNSPVGPGYNHYSLHVWPEQIPGHSVSAQVFLPWTAPSSDPRWAHQPIWTSRDVVWLDVNKQPANQRALRRARRDETRKSATIIKLHFWYLYISWNIAIFLYSLYVLNMCWYQEICLFLLLQSIPCFYCSVCAVYCFYYLFLLIVCDTMQKITIIFALQINKICWFRLIICLFTGFFGLTAITKATIQQ